MIADLTFTERDGFEVARVVGEIDLSNAVALQDAIATRLGNLTLGLVLDLSSAEYMDSAGIRMIYQLRSRLRDRGLDLRLVIAEQSPIADALRLAGVSGQIASASTVDAALAGV